MLGVKIKLVRHANSFCSRSHHYIIGTLWASCFSVALGRAHIKLLFSHSFSSIQLSTLSDRPIHPASLTHLPEFCHRANYTRSSLAAPRKPSSPPDTMTVIPAADRQATPVIEVNLRVGLPRGSEPYILHQQGGCCARVYLDPAAPNAVPKPSPRETPSNRPEIVHAATQTDAQDSGKFQQPPQVTARPKEVDRTELSMVIRMRTISPCFCPAGHLGHLRSAEEGLAKQRRREGSGMRDVPDQECEGPGTVEGLLMIPFAVFSSWATATAIVKCGLFWSEYNSILWLVLAVCHYLFAVSSIIDDNDMKRSLKRAGYICPRCGGVTRAGKARLALAERDLADLASARKAETLEKTKSN